MRSSTDDSRGYACGNPSVRPDDSPGRRLRRDLSGRFMHISSLCGNTYRKVISHKEEFYVCQF